VNSVACSGASQPWFGGAMVREHSATAAIQEPDTRYIPALQELDDQTEAEAAGGCDPEPRSGIDSLITAGAEGVDA